MTTELNKKFKNGDHIKWDDPTSNWPVEGQIIKMAAKSALIQTLDPVDGSPKKPIRVKLTQLNYN